MGQQVWLVQLQTTDPASNKMEDEDHSQGCPTVATCGLWHKCVPKYTYINTQHTLTHMYNFFFNWGNHVLPLDILGACEQMTWCFVCVGLLGVSTLLGQIAYFLCIDERITSSRFNGINPKTIEDRR